MIPLITKILGRTLILAAFVTIASNASAVLLVGNPYTPSPGANFQIFALQGIDASTPQGKTGFSPQVNRDFEFPDSIGVSYDKGGGQLTNFGLGLYSNAQGQVQSTGLKIQYNGLVDTSMVNITVEDFDIHAGKDTFFNPSKVEPNILLLGQGNTVFASATPKDIFPALVPQSGAKADTWSLNFGDLLNNLHIANGQISGFILSADALNGERPNSDPYLLVSVGNGCMVPEPANYAVGLAGIAFGGLFQLRQLRARRKSTVSVR